MVESVDGFGFLTALFFTVAFLVMLLVGLLYSIGPIGNYLRKRFPQSTETVKNAMLTCEHGHKVRVYVNMPGIIKGETYNSHRDSEFWVDPKRCPVCGGRWLMPKRHQEDESSETS